MLRGRLWLVQEDGNYLLLEDGSRYKLETWSGSNADDGSLARRKRTRKRIKTIRELVEAARRQKDEAATREAIARATAETVAIAETMGQPAKPVETIEDVLAEVGRLSGQLATEIKALQAEDLAFVKAQKTARVAEERRLAAQREADRLALQISQDNDLAIALLLIA